MLAQTSNDTPATFGSRGAGAAVLLQLSDCGRHYHRPRSGCECDACEGQRESDNARHRVTREVRRRYPALGGSLVGTSMRTSALDVVEFVHEARVHGRPWVDRVTWALKFKPHLNPKASRGAAARHWCNMLRRLRRCGFRFDTRTVGHTDYVRIHPDGLALAHAVLADGFDPDEDRLSAPRPRVEFEVEVLPVRREVARLRAVRRRAAWDAHVARRLREARRS